MQHTESKVNYRIMKQEISHFPKHIQEDLQSIVEAIKPVPQACIVILFGSFARGTYTEREWSREENVLFQSDYDILVVWRNFQLLQKKSYDLDEKLRALNLKQPLGLIHEPWGKFKKMLEENRYFYADVAEEGIMLFNRHNYELPASRSLSNEEKATIAQEEFDIWFKKAANLFDVAEFSLMKGYLHEAAFLTHQVTESCYNCNQLVFAGYKNKEHDLNKLDEKSPPFLPPFKSTFIEAKGKGLWKLLVRAYLDSRYDSKNYHITSEQLIEMREMIAPFIKSTKIRCTEYIRLLRTSSINK